MPAPHSRNVKVLSIISAPAVARTNANQQTCVHPGAWFTKEVWDTISDRFACWQVCRQAVVNRFLRIGLVRPSERTLQATVAVLFLARHSVTDHLDVED